MKPQKVLIALGGNAIVVPGERGDLDEQFRATLVTMEELAEVIRDGVLPNFLLTHGNGPQVGNIILRSELASEMGVYPLPVDICVSDSEGGMGYMIQQCLQNSLAKAGVKRTAATIITQIVVDSNDPALKNPTKFIGSFMNENIAKEAAAEKGWSVKEDSGRGWRRVIASPTPVRIVELDAIKALYNSGVFVIAAGGGGIPVIDGPEGLTGIAGVIDKDLASALLANEMGFDTLVILTGSDGVYTNYKKPDQKHHPVLSVTELKAIEATGQFPAGSMGPKVKAAIKFLERGGQMCIITEPGKMRDALLGKAGTQILPG